MKCETCKYSRPIEGDVEELTEMITLYEDYLQKEYEEQAKSSIIGRSYAMAGHYTIMISTYESLLKDITNNVMCYRFPQSVKKKKIDLCGEYSK